LRNRAGSTSGARPLERRRNWWVTNPASRTGEAASPTGVVLPLRYRQGDQELSFFSISATVGTATDVTVEELTIEAFYPADAATAAALRSPE
jgi:MmyB-like transcription regulator ligand binding domain